MSVDYSRIKDIMPYSSYFINYIELSSTMVFARYVDIQLSICLQIE